MIFVYILGALLITSGLLSHICIGAMLIMPTPQKKTIDLVIDETDNSRFKGKTDLPEPPNHDLTHEIYEAMPVEKDSAKYITSILITNYHFLLLLMSTWMLHGGSAVVFTHIMAFAQSQGKTASFGSMMISAIGFSMLIGRILLGLLLQAPRVNAILLYMASVLICGKFALNIEIDVYIWAVYNSIAGIAAVRQYNSSTIQQFSNATKTVAQQIDD